MKRGVALGGNIYASGGDLDNSEQRAVFCAFSLDAEKCSKVGAGRILRLAILDINRILSSAGHLD